MFLFPPALKVGLGIKLCNESQVQDVVEGGPCWKLLKNGDILLEVNGNRVKGLAHAARLKYTMGREGSTARLLISRDGVPQEVTVQRKFVNIIGSFEQRVRTELQQNKKRRSEEEIRKVFVKYSSDDKGISREDFLLALKEFDVAGDIEENDIRKRDFLFDKFDFNGNGQIDFNEFKASVQYPLPLEEWMRSINLHLVFADGIPRKVGEDPLYSASKLTEADVRTIVDGVMNEFASVLHREVIKLHKSFSNCSFFDEKQLGHKFVLDAPKMHCGSVEDFHRGLVERIGEYLRFSCEIRHLLSGQAHMDFLKAMQSEHCAFAGETEFEAPNYMVKTCPKHEWMIVRGEMDCPPQALERGGRRIPAIPELLNSDEAKEANLKEPEVVAVVMYTGPMYIIYNTVLRRFPTEVFEKLKKADNFYPTTISVLVSALMKLSRVNRIEPGTRLFRGISHSVELPDLFFRHDVHGCSGYTEFAFMSTTHKMDVALSYAKRGNGSMGRLLVLETGSVDRGACISSFSQHPGENEHVFVPCSFVEQSGALVVEVTESFGVVGLVPVKVNANVKARTIEEQQCLKKEMHVTAFRYMIEEIDLQLRELANSKGKDRIANDKSADGNLSVAGFVSRIVVQCKEVLSRHQAIKNEDFIDDALYRHLVIEMIEVREMAIAKFREWIENTDSFIRFRWNAELRSSQRNWIAYLSRKQETLVGADRQDVSLELCKALGLVTRSIDERNDLGETRIMSAAAKGLPARLLELLVNAGALVQDKRADGVNPIWLAARGGHVESISALMKLKADVHQAANEGATPIFIAARNGYASSIEKLVECGGLVNQGSKHKSFPIHQATLYGHRTALEMLLEKKADINVHNGSGLTALDIAIQAGHDDCAEFLRTRHGIATQRTSKLEGNKRLIINTGDISDIDGFFALAEYASSGADVLFIMNYPAYIGVPEGNVDDKFADENPGLGYKYSAKEVLDASSLDPPEHYTKFLQRYVSITDSNDKMKQMMTDLAFSMARRVWEESVSSQDGVQRGELLFGIGGVNSINPFSASALKNEILVYSQWHDAADITLPPEQGVVYDTIGKICKVSWCDYSHIYIDFNGSMAFWNGYLAGQLSEKDVVGKIQGIFIMGGVFAHQQARTSPSSPGKLNRFSSATMNQLYHPQYAADFFAFVDQFKIPAWIVPNNMVEDLATRDADGKPTLEGVKMFMAANGLTGGVLVRLAELHYSSKYDPPRKPFDLYCARALKTFLTSTASNTNVFTATENMDGVSVKYMTLFYSNVYGITIVSTSPQWETTRRTYIKVVDVVAKSKPDDDDDTKAKKEHLKKELDIMEKMDFLSSIVVRYVTCRLDESKRLSVGI